MVALPIARGAQVNCPLTLTRKLIGIILVAGSPMMFTDTIARVLRHRYDLVAIAKASRSSLIVWGSCGLVYCA